ncbi:MAG: type II toxin-antitoxin system VapC family toxin [Lachnospiraceae bacterium]|nr:type II toxin-antitoxin system VapC family toxin [Lachnospiraceae bacterium]
MRYMLDTNMIAYAKNRQPIYVLQKLQQHDPSEICISSITMAELEFGIFNSSKPAQNCLALMMFLSNISILPFDNEAAYEYGDIRHYLKTRGIIIGGNDMLIAAHARSSGIILVTHNTREFSRIQNLSLEDWCANN